MKKAYPSILLAGLMATVGCGVRPQPAARPLQPAAAEASTHSAQGDPISGGALDASRGIPSVGSDAGPFGAQVMTAEAASYGLVVGPVYRLLSRYDASWADFQAVAIGDVDGDRRDDLVARSSDNTVHVLRQRQDGTLSDAERFTFGHWVYSTLGDDLVLADMDGDGVRDIVYSASENVDECCAPLQGMLGVARWKKGRGWDNRLHLLTDDGYGFGGFLVPIDVDRDGHLDLVAAWAVQVENDINGNYQWECGVNKTYCSRYRVAFGDGRGGFSRVDEVKLELPYQFENIAVSDLNWDGRSDLVLTLRENETGIRYVFALYQSGYGTLLPAVSLYEDVGLGPGGPFEVFGDVNSDGIDDVVAFTNVRTVSLSGIFSEPSHLPFVGAWHAPAAILSDLDGDRRLDLVNQQLASIPGSPFSIPVFVIYLQKDGFLVPWSWDVQTTHHYSNHKNGIAAGDLNGDGCGDVAVAGATDGVAVFYGTGCVTYIPPKPVEPEPKVRSN